MSSEWDLLFLADSLRVPVTLLEMPWALGLPEVAPVSKYSERCLGCLVDLSWLDTGFVSVFLLLVSNFSECSPPYLNGSSLVGIVLLDFPPVVSVFSEWWVLCLNGSLWLGAVSLETLPVFTFSEWWLPYPACSSSAVLDLLTSAIDMFSRCVGRPTCSRNSGCRWRSVDAARHGDSVKLGDLSTWFSKSRSSACSSMMHDVGLALLINGEAMLEPCRGLTVGR